jgi:hypothetical protein
MVHFDRPRTKRRWIAAIGVVFTLTALAACHQSALGQNYNALKPNEQDGALRGKAATVLRNSSAPSADDLQTLSKFFTWYFQSMTGKSPAQLAALGKLRQDLFRLLNTPGSPVAREHVMGIAIKAMTAFAKGNFHPAVRYNAALVLGQLDKEPTGTGANAAAPVPLAASTGALVDLLEGGHKNPVAIPSSVTVGALVALERQTRLGIDPQYADRIAKAALAVATAAERPEDVSAPVFDWMRSLAARVLANQFAKGVTPPVHTALVKLITDKKMGLDDRCAVADAFTTGMYQEAQGVNVDEAAAALGALARDVLAEEAEAGEDYQSEIVPDDQLRSGAFSGEFGRGGGYGGEFGRGGGYGGEFGGGYGRGGADALAQLQDQTPRFEKRRMLDRLAAIVHCGRALEGAAGSDELKKRMKDLVDPMVEVADEAAKANATDADVAAAVIELSADVNDLVKSWTAAAAGPAEAPAADPLEAAAAEPAEAAPGN